MLIIGSYGKLKGKFNLLVGAKMKLSICCGAAEHEAAKGFCSKCKEATTFENVSSGEAIAKTLENKIKEEFPGVNIQVISS